MLYQREIGEKAEKYLEDDKTLVFVGARQVGKTTILKQLQSLLQARGAVCHFINLENPELLAALNGGPKNIFKLINIDLSRRTHIFIDEVQYLDDPSNFLKVIYDEYFGKIKIIASGSSSFYIDKKFKDSLAGRKWLFNVYTLSFREFLRFKDETALAVADLTRLNFDDRDKISRYYHEYMIFGGYPRVVLARSEDKVNVLNELAFSYIKKDIAEGNIRQEELYYKLFRLLASQAGNLVNTNELGQTLAVSKTAISNYLYVMQKSFHICLIRPFFSNARKEMTKMPKVYFYDSGLRNFFTNNFEAMAGRTDKGQVLENAAFGQLVRSRDEFNIQYWRTPKGGEIDFVIDVGKIAYEVKYNFKDAWPEKYKSFRALYPAMPLKFVTIDYNPQESKRTDLCNIWEI